MPNPPNTPTTRKGILISLVLTLAVLAIIGVVGAAHGYSGWKVGITLVALGWLLLLYFALGLVQFESGSFNSASSRLLIAALLIAPYPLYAFGTGTFDLTALLKVGAFALAPLLVLSLSPHKQRLTWLDALAIAAIWFPIEFRWLANTWTWPRADISNVFTVLLAVDVGVIGFVIVRGLDGVGYRFRLSWSGLKTALLSCALFLAIGVPFGLATGFLVFNPRLDVLPTVGLAVGLFLVTGIPEELLFRGIIQNLLSKTLGRPWLALIAASLIFGVAHLNNGDWRFLVLASLAGGFYGWAYWRTGGLVAPAITHALVDAVWSAYLRR